MNMSNKRENSVEHKYALMGSVTLFDSPDGSFKQSEFRKGLKLPSGQVFRWEDGVSDVVPQIRSSKKLFTLNKSPLGNKKARDQFFRTEQKQVIGFNEYTFSFHGDASASDRSAVTECISSAVRMLPSYRDGVVARSVVGLEESKE